ncbi:MAG: tyrosine--tRNA ligase [Patescibacteria group bacterium]|nr:tyrosine--tRNA ligase [Patescibacteria group bacterium]
MAKILTDKNLISEILERGVEKVYPGQKELEAKLLKGEVLRVYCGFDPSASSLHIGNAIALSKLAQFQRLGHKVIFLIGGFTGMIGDPSDKSSARKQLSREEVMNNATNFHQQAQAYLSFKGDNPAELRYNNEWHDKLSFKDLIELSANFTVQQMIQRDMFQKRLAEERPVFLHEFLYPLAQAYDSVALDVDVEVGGNDQMFNMMCGRDLLKALKGKDKNVLTMKLLTDNEGKKMGKSEGNIVMLDENANNMYGKVMSWDDGVLISAFELCTNLPWEEAKDINLSLSKGELNPRDAKMRLAWEITAINHGKEGADIAQTNFIKTVQNKEVPEEIEVKEMKAGEYKLIDLVSLLGLSASRGEAKRVIEQGGVKVGPMNGLTAITDTQAGIKVETNLIVQRGKRQFVKILIK